MEWIRNIRRDWRDYARRHRRLLRRQLNRGAYFSLTSLLQSEYMTMTLWGTPAVAERVENGVLHMRIKETGDRLLVEAKTTEGFGADWSDHGALGVYMLFTGMHTVEVVVGFSDDSRFREFVQQYLRDCLEDHARGGIDSEMTMDDEDGTLTAFGLQEVGVVAAERRGAHPDITLDR